MDGRLVVSVPRTLGLLKRDKPEDLHPRFPPERWQSIKEEFGLANVLALFEAITLSSSVQTCRVRAL
eukprot:scaffold276872_cov24-Tisochrysis_lutea.AAC.1